MQYKLRSEHVHFFVSSKEDNAEALLASLLRARSLISAAIVAPVLTEENGKYVSCSGVSGYEQVSRGPDTLHRWLQPDKNNDDDIATDEVDADWVPEDDAHTGIKATRLQLATGKEEKQEDRSDDNEDENKEDSSDDNDEEDESIDHDDPSSFDKIYEVYIHLDHRPNFRKANWAFQYFHPLISRCTPPTALQDQQTLAKLMCRPMLQMHQLPKLNQEALLSYLTHRWSKQFGNDEYDANAAEFAVDIIRKHYVKGKNEGDALKTLRAFEASHNLRPATIHSIIRRLQTVYKPPAQPFVGRYEFKFLPDPQGRRWVVDHLLPSSSPSREERHKPLVLWSKGKRLGTSKWAQHFGVHCYMRTVLDKKYLTDCTNDPACRYVVLDEIPWSKLLTTQQALGEDLLGGQISTSWKNGRDDVTVRLGLPVIIISHRNEKPPTKFLDRFNPTGDPLYVLVGLDERRLMYDETKPRVVKTHALPTAPTPCSCRVDAVNQPAPVAAAAPPPISAPAASSAVLAAPPSPAHRPTSRNLMAGEAWNTALLSAMENLQPPPTIAAAAASPFSLTPSEKKAVKGLPDTWIMYNVITPEVEEILNRAAEQEGGPWIEFVQSRNGQPLTRLKKVQCVCHNDWIRWYWYPDTKPDEWLPFTAINARLALLLTTLCGGRYILTSLVLNKYRDETDNIVAHHDKTGDLDPGSPIVTFSTGPLARTIVFIHQDTGKEIQLTVPPRSVYSIGWETNKAWKHSVPAMKGVTGERFGWTFRSVVSQWNRVTHALVQRPQIGEDLAVWDVLLPVANPDRPEVLQSYKVVQKVRLAEPGQLQPSDLEQVSAEAQSAYSGSTARKASNPKHRKVAVDEQPPAQKKEKKKRKQPEKVDKQQAKRPATGVLVKAAKKQQAETSSSSEDE